MNVSRFGLRQTVAGIPSVYYYGQESNQNILVMELLERNIETVFVEETYG